MVHNAHSACYTSTHYRAFYAENLTIYAFHFHMYESFVCMCVCVPRVCWCLWTSESIEFPGNGVANDREPACGCWKWNLCPQQEQHVLNHWATSLVLVLKLLPTLLLAGAATPMTRHWGPKLVQPTATKTCSIASDSSVLSFFNS